MSRNKTLKVFAVLRFLGKLTLTILHGMVYFAIEEQKPRPAHGVLKAQALSDDGLISNAELARAIHGDSKV